MIGSLVLNYATIIAALLKCIAPFGFIIFYQILTKMGEICSWKVDKMIKYVVENDFGKK